MKQPYEECPSFERCSCNVCPLDHEIINKFSIPEDDKCKANSTTRRRIAIKYTELLPYQGLTKKKWDRKQIWLNKSPAERELVLVALAKTRKLIKKPYNQGGLDA